MQHMSCDNANQRIEIDSAKSAGKRHGFTLIEMLAVITIMIILAGMTLGVYNLVMRLATEAKTKAEMQQIENALAEYLLENGRYPASLSDAAVVARLKPGVDLKDSWGNEYVYTRLSGERSMHIYSKGKDGLHGNEDSDADDLVSGK